jgi:predicted CXXCH cytochrome family protein
MHPERGEMKGACLHCHSTDYRHGDKGGKPTLESAKYGVTCVACHEPHGQDRGRPGQGDGSSLCGGCHIDGLARITAKTGKAHTPCPSGSAGCADCHMPKIVKTGGYFSLRSHAFRIVPPQASRDSKMPNSCQNGGCHQDKSTDWAIQSFNDHYPDSSAIKSEK